MTHLKDIEDELDGLETELSQKDEQIKELNDEYIKAKSKNEEKEKRASELQDQIDSYKKLLKQHEEHAQKSANAMEKARLLCELLQTDIEIKDLTISQLNSDVHSLKSQMKDKRKTKGSVPVYRMTEYKKEQTAEERDVKVASPRTTYRKDEDIKEKDEQTSKLREQIIQMASVMEDDKEHNRRVIAEKDKEIEKQEKTIEMINNLYHSLKTESKREKILRDVLPETDTNDDVVAIMNDFENQLKSMKDEVEDKAKTVKGLKENITEIRRDEDEIDRDLLSRKENVHKLLSIQLEEKEKKLKRMENLLEGLKEIYHSRAQSESVEASKVGDLSALPVDSAPKEGDAEERPKNDDEQESKTASREEAILDDRPEKELQREKEIVPEDENILDAQNQHQTDSADENDGTGNNDTDKGLNPVTSMREIKHQYGNDDNEKNQNLLDTPCAQALMEYQNSKYPSETSRMPSVGQPSRADRLVPENIEAKHFPTSGWKAKLLAYIAIGIGLSFLPQYLKTDTLRVVLAFVATPLFFLLSAIEVKAYRKRAENYIRALAVKEEGATGTALQLVDDYLLDEERKLREESEKKVIEELQKQLEQEIRAKAVKEEGMRGNDEVDVLEEQRRKVCYLEKTLHGIEMAKIQEQEQNKANFDEYIKLRNAVEELKRKRDAESKSRLEQEDMRKHETARLDNDLRAFSLRPRSLPLWIALAVGIYYLTGVHPAAPCGITVLLTLYAANSWFKIRNFKNKLLEEREATEYKNAELEDLTDLLEKEQEVVETQKAAIDIMVREIDNEYVCRKKKTVTLAKLILQMKELEEMRCALKEENVEQDKDDQMDAAMKNISKEKASERVRLYFEVSRNLPELEEDSLDNFGELEKTVKELASCAEAPILETENQSKTAPTLTPVNARKNSFGQKLIIIAGVTLSTVAMVTTMVFKSYIPAVIMAALLLIYLLSQIQRQNGLQQSKDIHQELQAKLEEEVKKNKANRLQIGKLKRLLATEKSLKKSDEAAKEIRLRVKERAEKRKMAQNPPS